MITRQQPRALFGPVLAFILVPAAAAFACAWIVKGGPGKLLPVITSDWTQWLVAACLAIVAIVLLGYSLPRFIRWRGVRYILTSGRIVARFGMLRRGDWQVPLAAVRSVGIKQSLLQRILRSGNISLDTGHPARPFSRMFRRSASFEVSSWMPWPSFRQMSGSARAPYRSMATLTVLLDQLTTLVPRCPGM